MLAMPQLPTIQSIRKGPNQVPPSHFRCSFTQTDVTVEKKRQSLLPFHVDFKWSFVLISPLISSSSVCLWSNQTFNWESETSSQSLYQTPAECIYFLQGSWRYKYKSTGKLDGGRENKKHRLWEVKCLIATTKRVTLHQNTASFKADSRGTKNVWASVNVWTKRLCSRPHARIIHLSENMVVLWQELHELARTNRSGIKSLCCSIWGPA